MGGQCPECGGEMVPAAYGRGMKVCESCGLQLNSFEYDRMWDKNRQEKVTDEDKKKRSQKDYLDWLQKKSSASK